MDDDNDTRPASRRAENASLASPAEHLGRGAHAHPAGRDREQVRIGSLDRLAAPGYAAPPGRGIDHDADLAALANASVTDRTDPDAAAGMGDEPALDLAPGALTTNPERDAVGLAPGAMTTDGNAPPTANSSGYLDRVYEGDRGRATSNAVPPPLPADSKQARGARVDQGDRGETFPQGRTRLAPGPEQRFAREPQIQNEPKGPFPPQHQGTPGLESELTPRPRYMAPLYKAAGKLEGKAALITGGDSGIGRAVAVLYAREGADVAIIYLPAEQTDALETQRAVENAGRRCLLIPGDLTDAHFCKAVIEQTVKAFGKLDILVSNAAHQNRKPSLDAITDDEFDETFKTNVYAYFRLCRAALRI